MLEWILSQHPVFFPVFYMSFDDTSQCEILKTKQIGTFPNYVCTERPYPEYQKLFLSHCGLLGIGQRLCVSQVKPTSSINIQSQQPSLKTAQEKPLLPWVVWYLFWNSKRLQILLKLVKISSFWSFFGADLRGTTFSHVTSFWQADDMTLFKDRKDVATWPFINTLA